MNRAFALAKRVPARSFDWVALGKRATDESSKAALGRLKATAEQISEAYEKYSVDAPAIDFAKFRSQISIPGLVDAVEKAYKEDLAELPDLSKSSNFQETVAALDEEGQQAVKEALALMVQNAQSIQDLEKEVGYLRNNRINKDTTVNEILDRYPEMREEIDDEIANYDFRKDT